jgi:hypothetical protein
MVVLREPRVGGFGSEFSWVYINPAGDDQGSTMAASRIEVWADAYAAAKAVEYIRFKGPMGTFRRSH